MIDQVIGSYRIVSPLGSGGMGAVWLAEHRLLGRRVAIKVLLPSLSQQQKSVERFFDEARAATKVADPGIVSVHDFGWHTDGSAYLVMEHLIGESLAARLRAVGRLPVAHALRIVQQAALGMAAAHACDIVHRDLKPDNIFLVRDPAVSGGERVKVLDFGVAKLLGDESRDHALTQSGIIMGTPMYMSPEQCRGTGAVDSRTDVYALGCVLFHVLCGRPPFTATTTADLIASHLTATPVAPSTLVPEIPPLVDMIVRRCLAKSAAERFATMMDLAEALADDATKPVTPAIGLPDGLVHGSGRSVPWTQSRGMRVSIAIGVAAVLLGAGVAVTMSRRARSTSAPGTALQPRASPPRLETAVDVATRAHAPDGAPPVEVAPASARPSLPRRTRRGNAYDPYADR